MIKRPTLLFLCHTLPYPPDGGVWIRTYNILRLLARVYDITLLCFERTLAGGPASSEVIAASADALRQLARVEVFPLPYVRSRRRLLTDHLRSTVSARVFTRYLYESPSFRTRLRDLVRSRAFDLVHVDSLDLSGYLHEVSSLPVICVHHNVESQLLQRRANAEKTAILRAYIGYQALLMRREERAWCPRADLNVTVSEQDSDNLLTIAPRARIAVVPNGVDTTFFKPRGPGREGVAFVGSNTWFANRDALAYFAEQILPLIRAEVPSVPVYWVGAATEEDRRRYQDQFGITMTGYADDVRDYIANALCYVVPLRVGGGTRLKILDAWSMGKAIVSTSVGSEGLDTVPEVNILVADTAQAFADSVLRVLKNPDLRQRLGAGGRATVERTYSWDVIGESMNELYRGVARSGGAIAVGSP